MKIILTYMTKTRFIQLLFFLHFFFIPDVSAEMRVWVDHGSVKIYQTGDSTGNNRNLAIYCAKNEFEPFQIFIFADQKELSNVNVTVRPFINKAGNRVDDIFIYREHYVEAPTPSRGDFKAGFCPDALLPKIDRYYHELRNTFPFSVSKGKVQGVWVDVGTTPETPAGTYRAEYTVSANNEPSIKGVITLTVWNFVIPSTSTMPNLWTIESALLDDGHGVSQNHNWLAAMKSVYLKALLYHRMGCSGGGEGGVVWTPCDKSGRIRSWKYWMRAFKDALDGTSISSGPYAGATMATDIHGHRSADTDRKKYRGYLQQWWNMWKSQGWDPMKNLFLWTWDEPNGSLRPFRGKNIKDYEIILNRAADMNAVDTRGEGIWRNAFVTEERKPELSNPENSLTSLDVSGFYCPLAVHYEYRPPMHSEDYKIPRSSYPGYKNWFNKHHWSYISCMNHACNRAGNKYWFGQIDITVDTPAVYTRAYNWVFWKYRVNGSLYYMTNGSYGVEPYKNLLSEGGNGNGVLFYPGIPDRKGRSLPPSTPVIGGRHDIPIESIRMKLIRESMEDFEYMVLLKSMGQEKFVDKQVDTIFTSLKTPPGPYYQVSTDIANILKARKNIARRIEKMQGTIPSKRPAAPKNFR